MTCCRRSLCRWFQWYLKKLQLQAPTYRCLVFVHGNFSTRHCLAAETFVASDTRNFILSLSSKLIRQQPRYRTIREIPFGRRATSEGGGSSLVAKLRSGSPITGVDRLRERTKLDKFKQLLRSDYLDHYSPRISIRYDFRISPRILQAFRPCSTHFHDVKLVGAVSKYIDEWD